VINEMSHGDFVRRDGHRGDMVFHEEPAPSVVDVNRNLLNLFVYLDFIEHQLVGHMEIPLLRIVPTKSTEDSSVTTTFENIHYINIVRQEIGSVHVRITDASGADIQFHSGKTILKLHFRTKS
jgi:hypothetical protein